MLICNRWTLIKYKYIEHIPTTTNMREKEIDRYVNAQKPMCTQYTDNNVRTNNNVVAK